MGPNGSGKSTLAGVLSGKPGYEVTEGSVTYQGRICSRSPPMSGRAKAFSLLSNIRSRFRA